MKKNFFKKLSFVLALAMIISALAPAAGAFAADAPHLSAQSKTLLLGQADRDNYDFNIAHKQKGWKYEWTSSNDDVASVESNGLTTANKIGTADIKVVITKSGKDVATLVAPVTVKDNIKSIEAVTCSDAKQDLNKLAVDTDYTFERTFTTFGGSTTDTTAKTIWSVNEGATISATGVFKATTAGKYTVTAMAFQSMDKYNTWKTTSDETLLLASKSIDVVVVPGVVKTAQVDADTFAVTFDSDMSKTTLATDGLLYQVINGKLVTTGAEKIKAVTFDTAGKVATIDVLANLTSGATYNFVYGDLVGSFTAASRTLADVKRIDFKDFNADVNTTGAGTDMLQYVTAYDANDVAILTGTEIAALNATALTFAYASTGDLSKAFVSGSRLFNFTLGYPAPVVATFDNFVYNSTTLKYDEVKLTDSAVGTGVKADTAIDPASIRFVVNQVFPIATPADDAAWGNSFTIAANDGLFYLHAEYKTKNMLATDAYLKSDDNAVFTYKSNDADKLLITGATLVPLAAGRVTVLVYSGTNVITSFEVVVAPARTFQSVSQDVASINIGNNAAHGETGNVKVTLLDSLGSKVTSGVAFGALTVTNAPAGGAGAAAVIGFVPAGAADSNGAWNLAITAPAVTPGAYTVKVPVTATINGTATIKDVYFTMIVGDATSAGAASTIVRYQASVSDTALNLKDVIAGALNKNVTVDVYGYNAAGYRVEQVSNADYSYTVDFNGATFAPANYTSDGVNDRMPVAVVSGGAMTTYATGTYLVKVTAVNALSNNAAVPANLIGAGNPVGYATLTVSDTTTKTFTQKASSVSVAVDATVAGAVAKAFEFKVNGNVAAAVTSVTYTNGSAPLATNAGATALVAGTTLYIDKVVVRVTTGGVTYDYTIDVKRTVAVNP